MVVREEGGNIRNSSIALWNIVIFFAVNAVSLHSESWMVVVYSEPQLLRFLHAAEVASYTFELV